VVVRVGVGVEEGRAQAVLECERVYLGAEELQMRTRVVEENAWSWGRV
jgi:hypothetical protein